MRIMTALDRICLRRSIPNVAAVPFGSSFYHSDAFSAAASLSLGRHYRVHGAFTSTLRGYGRFTDPSKSAKLSARDLCYHRELWVPRPPYSLQGEDWLGSALYRLRRWMASLRPYPPLTPVEEGLLADLARSATVDNALSEDSMSKLLHEWWGLVTIGGSAAPDLPRDERWKSVGFQSARPSTDFRTGPHALLCMVQAARAYGPEFREMVAGSDGYGGGASNRFHYPFAATAINVHFMLLHYLRMVDGFSPVTKESVLASDYERKVFASAMALTAGAFEDLFTATCMAVHTHWTRMVADEEATLMDFQESLAYGLSRAANALVKANPVRDEASWHTVLRNICISFPPPAAPSLV